jgi:hypothetical protein
LSKKKRTKIELSSDKDNAYNEEDKLSSSLLTAATLATNITENVTTLSTDSSDFSIALSRSQKQKRHSLKKSCLCFEMQPFFKVISSDIERIGQNKKEEQAIEDRLLQIETKIKEVQVELKSSMSAIL